MGVLRCLPAQPMEDLGGVWLDTGEGGLETNNKNSIQSRTFDHAGAPPPPHPSGHLGSSLGSLVQPQHRSVQEGEGSGTKFLEPSAVFLVAAKSRELERKGSAGAISDPSAPGSAQPPLSGCLLEAGSPPGFNQQQRPRDENPRTT